MPAKRKRNALLPEPPRWTFKLERKQYARHPRILDGVHFTTNFGRAAGYAFAAFEADMLEAGEEAHILPVVLEVDTSGVRKKPDLDAVILARRLLKVPAQTREEYDEELFSTQAFESEGLEMEIPLPLPGAYSFLRDLYMSPASPAFAFEDQEEWAKWRATGRYTAEHMSALIEQFKVMEAFGWDRIFKVYFLAPVYSEVLFTSLETAEALAEETGWEIFTDGEVSDFEYTTRVLGTISGPAREGGSFHGTSSARLVEAFPQVARDVPVLPARADVQALVDAAD